MKVHSAQPAPLNCWWRWLMWTITPLMWTFLNFYSPVSEDAATGTVIALLSVRDEDLGPTVSPVACTVEAPLSWRLASSATTTACWLRAAWIEQVSEYRVLITASGMVAHLHLALSQDTDCVSCWCEWIAHQASLNWNRNFLWLKTMPLGPP